MTASLENLRNAIEALAQDGGEYRLVCARHGDEPVPATGLCFESRATARVAARAVEQYRQSLREYDPALAVHEIVVVQAGNHRHRTHRDEQSAPAELQQFRQRHD
ncbi:DUF7552 domain-containing protein [Halovenus halobia]|uniref:DUF7552 domain-containing protein n=1 Tax=Halovenus halobia TaxID=3396622 RepID=UPI003F54D479